MDKLCDICMTRKAIVDGLCKICNAYIEKESAGIAKKLNIVSGDDYRRKEGK